MLARLLPGGEASDATSELGDLVPSLAAVKEAHHFYPLLFYFHFRDPLYSVSRIGFVILDLTALIEHALDRRRYEAVADSAAVAALRRGAMLLLGTVERHFPTVEAGLPDAAQTWRVRKSFALAVERLARSRIAVWDDGAASYQVDRRAWEPLTRSIAPAVGYDFDDIDKRYIGDPACTRPDATRRCLR